MPELPAEAVQAAAEAMGLAIVGKSLNDGTSSSPGFTLEQLAEFGLRAAAPFLVGVGSPASCPSAAPESTHSPQSPSVAPVYRPGVERPAETLSELRDGIARAIARRAGSQAFDHTDRAWDDLRNRWLSYADAVLAVRDDELARALRIADYHAGQHRQAADAIARVHQVCHTALATPDAPDRWAVAAQVRAALEGPEPQVGAGAVSEEQTEPVRHLGGNAEDCPACDITTLPYPFLCPGEEPTTRTTTTEGATAMTDPTSPYSLIHQPAPGGLELRLLRSATEEPAVVFQIAWPQENLAGGRMIRIAAADLERIFEAARATAEMPWPASTTEETTR